MAVSERERYSDITEEGEHTNGQPVGTEITKAHVYGRTEKVCKKMQSVIMLLKNTDRMHYSHWQV